MISSRTNFLRNGTIIYVPYKHITDGLWRTEYINETDSIWIAGGLTGGLTPLAIFQPSQLFA